ncbi:MAG: hypothetical protein NTX71_01675 [Candidatus Aureabacteria bacterium]|nr:hypothetical protein [Candidatus Auribacterota bacterium]
MHESSAQDGVGKLKFESDEPIIPRRIQRPLAERILLRYPRIASVLAAVGAKSVPHGGQREQGALATMMAASGSIDVGRRQRKNYRFYTRPMS